MGETVLVVLAVGAGLLIALGWRPIVSSGGDNELCWSCGQRAAHKLWCPNR